MGQRTRVWVLLWATWLLGLGCNVGLGVGDDDAAATPTPSATTAPPPTPTQVPTSPPTLPPTPTPTPVPTPTQAPSPTPCVDRDADGVCGSQDCNDADATVSPLLAEQCTDLRDNDCDGTTDCADSGCAAHASCLPACTDAAQLSCGYSGGGDTSVQGTWGDVNIYSGCGNPYADNASEDVYGFSVTATRQVTVTLVPTAGDNLNLWLLRGVCDPANCIDYAHDTSGGTEVLTFNASAGVDYHVVVDGWSFHTGPYTLQVTCN